MQLEEKIVFYKWFSCWHDVVALRWKVFLLQRKHIHTLYGAIRRTDSAYKKNICLIAEKETFFGHFTGSYYEKQCAVIVTGQKSVSAALWPLKFIV